jgi:hypothetical protein
MNFRVMILWINALLFVAFGIGFIVSPGLLSLLVTGAAPGTPNAMIDMRVTLWGMALGAGLLFGYCARRPSRLRIGLFASLLMFSGIAGGRMVGIFMDGSPNGWIWILLAAELFFAGIYAIALKRTPDF